ncbi:uncharacterized protein LOC118439030 [Folsomia candida]|nr:uncharacterized protein LOC118439030 [Folsomia candida]
MNKTGVLGTDSFRTIAGKDLEKIGYTSTTTGEFFSARQLLRELRGLPCSEQLATCVQDLIFSIYIFLTALIVPAGYFMFTRTFFLRPEVSSYTQLRHGMFSCILFGTLHLLILLTAASINVTDHIFDSTYNRKPSAYFILVNVVGIFPGFHLAKEIWIWVKKRGRNNIELLNLNELI